MCFEEKAALITGTHSINDFNQPPSRNSRCEEGKKTPKGHAIVHTSWHGSLITLCLKRCGGSVRWKMNLKWHWVLMGWGFAAPSAVTVGGSGGHSHRHLLHLSAWCLQNGLLWDGSRHRVEGHIINAWAFHLCWCDALSHLHPPASVSASWMRDVRVHECHVGIFLEWGWLLKRWTVSLLLCLLCWFSLYRCVVDNLTVVFLWMSVFVGVIEGHVSVDPWTLSSRYHKSRAWSR